MDRDTVARNRHTVKASDRHARVQEKVRSKNKENAGHGESPGSTRGVRPRDSPSPVHNTLGQVSVFRFSSQGYWIFLYQLHTMVYLSTIEQIHRNENHALCVLCIYIRI